MQRTVYSRIELLYRQFGIGQENVLIDINSIVKIHFEGHNGKTTIKRIRISHSSKTHRQGKCYCRKIHLIF